MLRRTILIPGSENAALRGAMAASGVCYLNLTYCGDTKSSMRRDVSFARTSILMGKLTMKRFGFGFFGQALTAAGVGAALLMSVSASQGQAAGRRGRFQGQTGRGG